MVTTFLRTWEPPGDRQRGRLGELARPPHSLPPPSFCPRSWADHVEGRWPWRGTESCSGQRPGPVLSVPHGFPQQLPLPWAPSACTSMSVCRGRGPRGGGRWAQQECVLWWSPPSFLPAFVPIRGLWAVQVLGPGRHASLWPRSGRLRCHRVRCVLLPVRGVTLSGVLGLPWAWVCHQWVCLWLVGQGRVTVLAAAGAVGSDGSDRK